MTPTREQCEKAIKDWRKKNGKDKMCIACYPRPFLIHIADRICLACQLDQALADYERAGERLTELISRC
jgi:hypothetical protein